MLEIIKDTTLSIYGKNPNAMACSSGEKDLIKGQKGILILNNSNEFQKVGYIFDISQNVSMDRNVNEVFVRENLKNMIRCK